MMKIFTLIVLIIISSVVALNAQSGNIKGSVHDAKTGEELPGVNVILKGTYYGAASDINGNFAIKNVSVGNYTIEVSLIGYKTVQFTGIEIQPAKTKELDVKMEETVLTLDQDVVVVGEKPFLDVEETQSKKDISKEDIAKSTPAC